MTIADKNYEVGVLKSLREEILGENDARFSLAGVRAGLCDAGPHLGVDVGEGLADKLAGVVRERHEHVAGPRGVPQARLIEAVWGAKPCHCLRAGLYGKAWWPTPPPMGGFNNPHSSQHRRRKHSLNTFGAERKVLS